MKIASASSESELERHIRRASKIARLELSEEEFKGILGDAEAILAEFSKIQELELTDSVEPVVATGSLRDDLPEKFHDVDGLLVQVPEMGEGGARLIKAPKSL